MDPLGEDFTSWTPYSYSFNSPLRFIDPTGMAPEDVIIKGSMAKEAFNELQSSVSNELILSMDSFGKLSYTQVQGAIIGSDAQQLINAIDDSSIVVNIIADNVYTTSSNELFVGGAFMGNRVTSTKGANMVVTEQFINPNVLKTLSIDYNKPGADTLHEVTEAYQGALISQKKGVSSPAGGQAGSVYYQAHNLATPQSGTVNQFIYDAKGDILQPTTTGGFPTNAASLEYKTINGTTILKVP